MIAKRSCPVCLKNAVDFIKEINFSLFEHHPMSNGYNLVQCNNCGNIFADVAISQIELDHYYSNLSNYENKKISTGGGYNFYDKKRLEGVGKYILKKFKDKSIKIADIGCANGGLLEQLKINRYKNLIGIDPSLSCVEITKNEKGINCIHSSLFEINESLGKFDLIILSHVWEHLLDLENAIKAIEKILAPEGYIYIECPNSMNYKKIIHAPFQELNTEHINHFNEIGFKNYFGLRNYECLEVKNKIFQMTSGEDYHAVFGIFKKSNNLNYHLNFDSKILSSFKKYLTESQKWYDLILNKIINETKEDISIMFYGIGQFAFKLIFDISKIAPYKNLILIDNNPLNAGKKIRNSTIFSGSEIFTLLKNNNSKIVITSLIHQDSIKKDIINKCIESQVTVPNIIELK